MLRIILLSLLGLYLIVIGAWAAAAAPVALLLAGLAAVVGLVPGSVWLLLGVIAWLALKNRPAHAPKAAV
jgi:hypothetical protein